MVFEVLTDEEFFVGIFNPLKMQEMRFERQLKSMGEEK